MKGYMRRGFNQSRSLEVSPKYLQEYREKRVERAPSGRGSVTGTHRGGFACRSHKGNERLSFQDFVADPNTYALEVRGESMIEDHICSGDYVLVEKDRRK